MSILKQTIFIKLLLLLLIGFSGAKYSDWEPIKPYCENAPIKCSPNRNDDAFMPYHGSRCYCDLFCFRSKDDHDCCPDFEYVCKNNQCRWDGRTFEQAETRIDQCNSCRCSASSQWECENDLCANDVSLIDRINNEHLTWTAKTYERWNGTKLTKLKTFALGTILDQKQKTAISSYSSREPDSGIYSFVPPSEWTITEGGWVSAPVRDQGKCGASWALSALDVAYDRDGDINNPLSLQHLLGCSEKEAKDGCKAGRVPYAWGFLKDFGVPEEISYESGRTGLIGHCLSIDEDKKVHQFSPAYKIEEDPLQIKYEMYDRGSVQATFLVCPDFFQYSEGIYKRFWSGDSALCDYHSVRIIGWGQYKDKDNQTKEYWLCVNSWGSDWGINGHFKIDMQDVDINKYVVATWGRNSKLSRR